MALVFFPGTRQNPGYHSFADQRTWLGIPNAANVLSSLPMAIVGVIGLVVTKPRVTGTSRATMLTAFAGLLLTGFGSAYYHLAPSSERLFWDRLPLGLLSMSLLTLALAWYVAPAAHRLLIPLLILAAAAAVTWRFGLFGQAGNLKWWWGIVEIYPVFAILLLMLFFNASPQRGRTLFLIVVCFAVAQILDTADAEVFRATHGASGHMLKHLLGAIAGVVLLLLDFHDMPRQAGTRTTIRDIERHP